MSEQTPTQNLAALKSLLTLTGMDVKAVRVSSAQAQGAAKKYSYWGAALYRVTIGAEGKVIARCTRRANSDRRSRAGAWRDAESIAADKNRVVINAIGALSDDDAAEVLAQVSYAHLADPL